MQFPDFPEELNQRGEKLFGENAKVIIHILLYAKLPPNLKKLLNMVRLENATYDDIVTHFESELERNGLEEFDDIPVPIMCTAPAAG